jgi:hypothetical protein
MPAALRADAFALLTCSRVAKVWIWRSVALISVPIAHRRTGRCEATISGSRLVSLLSQLSDKPLLFRNPQRGPAVKHSEAPNRWLRVKSSVRTRRRSIRVRVVNDCTRRHEYGPNISGGGKVRPLTDALSDPPSRIKLCRSTTRKL